MQDVRKGCRQILRYRQQVDLQEVYNALNQSARDVRQRFDFKGTDASISWSGDQIAIQASARTGEGRLDVSNRSWCAVGAT
jgi:uncharacterized protein YajQ (UPF0234 family)